MHETYQGSADLHYEQSRMYGYTPSGNIRNPFQAASEALSVQSSWPVSNQPWYLVDIRCQTPTEKGTYPRFFHPSIHPCLVHLPICFDFSSYARANSTTSSGSTSRSSQNFIVPLTVISSSSESKPQESQPVCLLISGVG